MTGSGSIPPFPGAVGLTHLRVYDTAAPDGLVGGSPHVHFACTEAYLVVGGSGCVQTLCAGGYKELPLEPGGIVWFTPGVIHRLINTDGQLEIQVVMQNAGLPEAGDFVLTFPPTILDDVAKYHEAAAAQPDGKVYVDSMATARHRRDLAVEGFLVLRDDFEHRGDVALDEFYQRAVRLVRPQIERWRGIVESGPAAAVAQTVRNLDALAAEDAAHLMGGSIHVLHPLADVPKLGMCGKLGIYLPEGVTA